MWNCLDLHCPSFDVVQYFHEDCHQIESLQDFVTVLTKAADVLITENPLWKETNVLQNIQVKFKRILRCDKCLIFLRRVSHCLKKIVLLNLSKDYLNLSERFLHGLRDTSVCALLPSRQQVEYILIRTQSAAKLICEAIQYSRQTFGFLIQKLKVGHLILDLITAASVTARLNALLNGTLVILCDLYQKVLVWCHKLKEGAHKWEKQFDLPVDLKKWLIHSEREILKCEADPSSSKEVICIENGSDDQDDSNYCFALSSADYGEIVPRKQAQSRSLTSGQKKILQKLLSVSSFKKLRNTWKKISTLKQQDLLVTLSVKKKKVIGRFLVLVQKRLVKQEKKQRIMQQLHTHPFTVHTAGKMLAKYLGFTQDQINSCETKNII